MIPIMTIAAAGFRNGVVAAALAAAVLAASCADAASLRAPGGGSVRALAIGVDTYPNLPRTAWLRGAVADARDVYQALGAAGVKATLLVERDAVRPRVVAEMNRLLGESRAGDLIIVSFAGHGMQVPPYPQWKGLDASGVNTQIVLSGYGRSGANAHDVIVDKEMRAWLARFDAKGVDVLLAIDACYGGAMRSMDPLSGSLAIRRLEGGDAQGAQNFVPIEMNAREARADINDMRHVTFLAGADPASVVPEMTGIDQSNRAAPRGALSYFVSRAITGAATNGGPVTREALFRFMLQNVKQATNDLQVVSLDPAVDTPAVRQAVVLRFDQDTAAPSPVPPPPQPSALEGDSVRVAVANGPESSLSGIQKGRAPFVQSGPAEADLVWDVAGRVAVSRGDRVMSEIDGTVLGGIIDRTWAIRKINALSLPRVMQMGLRQGGLLYTPADRPEFFAAEVRDRYLTVLNITADGKVEMLFPFHASDDPHMRTDSWSYRPVVRSPFGADHVVGIATSRPAAELGAWLKAHDGRHEAAELPEVIARAITDDPQARIGTVGLYTAATR